MTTITLDITAFRATFPQFADPLKFPDELIQLKFDLATGFISPVVTCGDMTEAVRRSALYLMTAHLLWLDLVVANGGTYTGSGGIAVGSKVGDVQVTLAAPPYGTSSWRFWLNQSPYGQQLLALLEAQAVGGAYFGGLPERYAFRRVGGGFGPNRGFR